MSPIREVSYISDGESEDDKSVGAYSPSPSPIESRRRSLNGQLKLPELSLEDSINQHKQATRPPLIHRSAFREEVTVYEAPSLVPSLSDESLPEEDWDMDASPPLKTPPAGARWQLGMIDMAPPLAKPAKALLDWDSPRDELNNDPHVRVEMYNGVGVVYSQ